MASVTTTTAAKLISEQWDDIDLNTQEEMVFANKIITKKPAKGKLNIPLMKSIGASTLSAGSGANLTFTANTEDEIEISPATRYAAVELEKQVSVRALSDTEGKYKTNLEWGLAAQIDADCLADVAALVTNTVSAMSGFDKPSALDAVQKLAAGAKRFFRPGSDSAIWVLHASQIDELLSISDFTSAQIRGGRETPTVDGWVVQAAGGRFYESGNVFSTGGTAYNVCFIPRAFAISYNQRPTPLSQEYQLVDRIINWADFAHGYVREAYAVQVLTPAA